MITGTETIILIILIALSGVFSGSETAMLSVTRYKVRLFLKQKKRGSASLQKIKSNPHRMLTTILICNNVVNISASVFSADIALKMNIPNPLAYATGVMTFLLLVFGEVVPKNLAATYPTKISLALAPLIFILSKILFPIILFFDFITVKVFRISASLPKITEEEVKNIVDLAKEEGGIDTEEKEMIHRIFKFDDVDIDEIKVPRTDMATLSVNSKLKDAINLINRIQHSRIPVYEKFKDKIVGIFYFKDALPYLKKKKYDVPINKLMRKPIFLPKTKKLDETLKLLQKRKQHMAILVDEHGGVTGLITIEDILEEIVGEIVDETEKIKPEIQKIGKITYRVLGKADIEEVNIKLKLKIPLKEDYDTISGYVLHELGRIPNEGEELEMKEYKVTVKKVEGNRIIEVVVERK